MIRLFRSVFWQCIATVILLAAIFLHDKMLLGIGFRNLAAIQLVSARTQDDWEWAENNLLDSLSWYSSLSAQRLLGYTYARQGKVDLAVHTWDNAGLTASQALATAKAFFNEGDRRTALQWLEVAQSLPGEKWEWYRIGNTFADWHDFNKAIDFYELALADPVKDNGPGDSDLYYAIGMIYQSKLRPPDFESALKAYEAAIVTNDFGNYSKRVEAYVQAASLLLGKDNERSVTLAQEAVSMMPDHVIAHTVLGLAIYGTYGDFARSDTEMDIASRIDPTSVWPLMHRAQLYMAASRYQEALEVYQQAYAMRPGLVEASRMIQYIQTHLIDQNRE